MINKTLFGVSIYSETLIRLIVIDEHRFAFPSFVAFNAEVIIAFGREPTLPISTFQNALCQRDRSGHARALHFFSRHFFVGRYVDLSRRQFGPLGRRCILRAERIRNKNQKRT